MFDYFVSGANGFPGIKSELAKRDAEGWELVQAYQETSSGFFLFFWSGRRHVLIFRRAKPSA